MFPFNTGGLPAGFSSSAKFLLKRQDLRRRFAGVWESAPERLLINRSFEYNESVSAVVGIDCLTIFTKIFGAECTTVPLSNDMPHMLVAEGKSMCEITKISYFDVNEQLPLEQVTQVMYLRGRLVYLRKYEVPLGIDICKRDGG